MNDIEVIKEDVLLDCSGALCPMPIVKTSKAIKELQSGQILKMIATDADLIDYFLDDARVAAVNGEAFGLSPAFRVSYATSEAILTDACTRMQEACAALK